jgi:spermidine synthase
LSRASVRPDLRCTRCFLLTHPTIFMLAFLRSVLQLTERDADAYNEMMTHVPMFQHKNPKRVLVIGGGDGYVLSEVIKHDSVEIVDHVDLDGDVIDVCREHFSWGAAWNDPRVRLHISDGAAFVRNAPDGYYDVVVQDSSDPWTWDDNGELIELASGVLYTSDHFANLHRILGTNGILNIQGESLQIPSDLENIAEWRQRALGAGFHVVRYGSIMISSYPTGQIGFLLCEKSLATACSPQVIQDRFLHMRVNGTPTSYYHPRLQSSSFDLPLWAEEALYGNDLVKNVCREGDQDPPGASEEIS